MEKHGLHGPADLEDVQRYMYTLQAKVYCAQNTELLVILC